MSIGFSSQEYWSGLPVHPAGDLPDPGMELVSLTSLCIAGGSLTTEPSVKPSCAYEPHQIPASESAGRRPSAPSSRGEVGLCNHKSANYRRLFRRSSAKI